MLGTRREHRQSKTLKFSSPPIILGGIAFVSCNYTRAARLPNALYNLSIKRRYPFTRIDHNDANRRVLDRERSLRARFIIKRVMRYMPIKCDTARIDEHDFAAQDFDFACYPITRHARLVEHYRDTLFRNAVKKRAFAGVRTPY
jgi:hypothetical protein